MTITEHYYISKLVRALWLVNLAGRTLPHGPLKFKVVCVAKLLRDFINYLASKVLKLPFTLNCMLKRSSELKTISNWLVLLSTCFRNLKPFLVDKNRFWTRQTHDRDIINILLTEFEVRTVSYGSSFFPLRFMARALRAWAINRRGKSSVRNLRYEPRTRLVRGMYSWA